MDFAKRLEVVRTAAGFGSMKAFAEAIGVEDETYRRYERAETEPPLATLARIRKVTGASLDFLIAGDLVNAGRHVSPMPEEGTEVKQVAEPSAAAQKPRTRSPFRARR